MDQPQLDQNQERRIAFTRQHLAMLAQAAATAQTEQAAAQREHEAIETALMNLELALNHTLDQIAKALDGREAMDAERVEHLVGLVRIAYAESARYERQVGVLEQRQAQVARALGNVHLARAKGEKLLASLTTAC